MGPTTPETTRGPQRIPLYSNKQVEVFTPRKPRIPVEEGLQIQIESSASDKRNDPRNILLRDLYGIMAAKVIAESGRTPTQAWANTRIETNNDVNAYGREVHNSDSWRRPVKTRDVGEQAPPGNIADLQKLFGKYAPLWKNLSESMVLFPDGIHEGNLSPNLLSEKVWESDSFVVDLAGEPHIKGLHVVVHPKERVERQWKTVPAKPEDAAFQPYIQSTLEATAIAIGIRELLANGGEIHNSGNWAKTLKDTTEGGKFSFDEFSKQPKKEKRTHRPDIAKPEDALDTSMHVHVYIPDEGKVFLPAMSKSEAGEEVIKEEFTDKDQKSVARKTLEMWTGLPRATGEQFKFVRDKLGGHALNNWLASNVQGKLSG